MIRGFLALGLVVCVIGFFSGDQSTYGAWLTAGFVFFVGLALAQKISEWLGVDDVRPPRRRMEYFFDVQRDLIASGPASHARSVGEHVALRECRWQIQMQDLDSDGDFIYQVAPR